jgi:hypothetical protein
MVDPFHKNGRNLKQILHCFEFLSRLKTKFHKSDVHIFEAKPEEVDRWKRSHMTRSQEGREKQQIGSGGRLGHTPPERKKRARRGDVAVLKIEIISFLVSLLLSFFL